MTHKNVREALLDQSEGPASPAPLDLAAVCPIATGIQR